MLLLIGWLLSVLGVGSIALFPMPAAVDLAMSLSAFGLCMAAAVLALVGLHEYSQHPKQYQQGRPQAIWTLALSAIIMTLLFLNVAMARRPPQLSNAYLVGGRPLIFQELNFKFVPPRGRWALETNSLESNVTLTLKWDRPEIHFLIIAQKAPHEKYSTENLADMVTESLRDKADSVHLLYRGPTRIDRLPGLRLHIETDRTGQKFYHEHRLFVTNDLTYQLTASGHQRDKEEVGKIAEFLAHRFELLDYSPRWTSETNSEFRRRYLQ
jgi:hypothetical protein